MTDGKISGYIIGSLCLGGVIGLISGLYIGQSYYRPIAIKMEDFNGDNYSDIVIKERSPAFTNPARIFLQDSTGTFVRLEDLTKSSKSGLEKETEDIRERAKNTLE